MQFKDVIGQDKVKAHLLSEAQSGRIPHAQLFLGRSGTGALPAALAFAQYINCEQPGPADSCGQCHACQLAAKLTHPDIHFAFPVVPRKSKPQLSRDYMNEWREAVLRQPYLNEFDWLQFIDAGNRQGNITAGECRQIFRQLQLKTFEGRYKVQIIWMVEALGISGNILLKLLEEPPDDTVLLLIAENAEEVLPTILSRTQIKVIEDLTAEEIAGALVTRGEAEGDDARQFAFLADGSFHRALELSRESSRDLFKWLDRWLTASMNNQASELVEFINFLHGQGREKVKHFLEYKLHFFRECLNMKFQPGAALRLIPAEEDLARRVWRFASLHSLAEVAELTGEKCYHVERNVNARYVLLDLSIKTRRIFRQQAARTKAGAAVKNS